MPDSEPFDRSLDALKQIRDNGELALSHPGSERKTLKEIVYFARLAIAAAADEKDAKEQLRER